MEGLFPISPRRIARAKVSLPEILEGFCRGVAFFAAALCAINLVAEFRNRQFEANLWWIDLRWLPRPAAAILLAALAGVLLLRAVKPAWLRRIRGVALGLLAAACGVCAINGIVYLVLLARGSIKDGIPLPFSWIMAGVLGGILRSIVRMPIELPCEIGGDSPRRRPLSRPNPVAVLGGLLFCIAAMPLAQMICFGNTDYRRPADFIVVFGARAYSDGTASQALADRVRTGCELYRNGLAPKLLFSGGPGDGRISEPQSMRALAISLGVAPEDIFLHERGFNTAATVENTIADAAGARVIAVSHFYHLPRIKLAYQAAGANVFTVPCRQSRVLSQLPKLMLREEAAIWAYYVDCVLTSFD